MSADADTQTSTRPRVAMLGGETRPRSMLGAPAWQIMVVCALGVVWILLLVTVQSPYMLAGGLVIAGVWAAMRRVDAHGDSWLAGIVNRVWFMASGRRYASRLAPGSWSPASGLLPVEVGSIRELTWDPGLGGELAFIHHKHKDKSWGPDSSLTASLEVIGSGEGLREVVDTNARGEDFGDFLAGLASAQMATDMVEIDTRVLPTSPEAHGDYQRSLLARSCPPLVRESMHELASWSAAATETYRSFVTVRMNLGALADKCPGTATRADIVAAAGDELREIAVRLQHAGLTVRGLVGPRRLGAMIRHTYVPEFSLDDTDGIDSTLDGWAWGYTAHRDAVRVDGPDGPWWHAVATVPRDAWPMSPVGMRWLEGLVTDVDTSAIRSIKAVHRLVPRREAREKARLARTYDAAELRTQERKGAISTGESEASASLADQVLSDVLNAKAGGDRVSLRVMVSAPSHHELRQARAALERAAETETGIARLRWCERRHHQAMLLAAPLGRGVRQ